MAGILHVCAAGNNERSINEFALYLTVLIFSRFDQVFLTYVIRLVGWPKRVTSSFLPSLDSTQTLRRRGESTLPLSSCWAHMLWLQCTSVTRSISPDEAMIEELGCAAYFG